MLSFNLTLSLQLRLLLMITDNEIDRNYSVIFTLKNVII